MRVGISEAKVFFSESHPTFFLVTKLFFERKQQINVRCDDLSFSKFHNLKSNSVIWSKNNKSRFISHEISIHLSSYLQIVDAHATNICWPRQDGGVGKCVIGKLFNRSHDIFCSIDNRGLSRHQEISKKCLISSRKCYLWRDNKLISYIIFRNIQKLHARDQMAEQRSRTPTSWVWIPSPNFESFNNCLNSLLGLA